MADIRDEIAEFIADTPIGPDGVPGVIKLVIKRFPGATDDDIDAGLDRGIDLLRQRADQDEAEADDLERLAPLFDGMPPHLTLGECAQIKAAQGDPLALAYLDWEKKQAGGVQ